MTRPIEPIPQGAIVRMLYPDFHKVLRVIEVVDRGSDDRLQVLCQIVGQSADQRIGLIGQITNQVGRVLCALQPGDQICVAGAQERIVDTRWLDRALVIVVPVRVDITARQPQPWHSAG